MGLMAEGMFCFHQDGFPDCGVRPSPAAATFYQQEAFHYLMRFWQAKIAAPGDGRAPGAGFEIILKVFQGKLGHA